MMQYPPDILLHENVLGFPHEKMAKLIGHSFLEHWEDMLFRCFFQMFLLSMFPSQMPSSKYLAVNDWTQNNLGFLLRDLVYI